MAIFIFSFKDQTSPNGVEIFETVFSDRVCRKTIVGGVSSKCERRRDDSISDWRDCLLPFSRQPPLSDYAQKPIRFCFATAAIPVANGRVGAVLDRLPPSEVISSQRKPIAVGSLGTGVINLSACLVGAGAPFTWPGDELIWSDRDNSHLPHIELCAFSIQHPLRRERPNEAIELTASRCAPPEDCEKNLKGKASPTDPRGRAFRRDRLDRDAPEFLTFSGERN